MSATSGLWFGPLAQRSGGNSKCSQSACGGLGPEGFARPLPPHRPTYITLNRPSVSLFLTSFPNAGRDIDISDSIRAPHTAANTTRKILNNVRAR